MDRGARGFFDDFEFCGAAGFGDGNVIRGLANERENAREIAGAGDVGSGGG